MWLKYVHLTQFLESVSSDGQLTSFDKSNTCLSFLITLVGLLIA